MRIENRKARHDYFIEQTLEVGMILQGWEVKAIRAGQAHLSEAYVRIIHERPYLIGCTITALTQASTHHDVEPMRTRELLMHSSELSKLATKVNQAGYTLVPLNVHFKNGRAKLDIGLCKGKQLHDKRQTLKDNDQKREVDRAMKIAR